MKQRVSRLGADFSLLLVTLVWGATFVVVKWAIADLPPFPFLAIRFALAFLSLLPFIILNHKKIDLKTVIKGLGIGVFLFSGYAWQTIGLQYTTASNAGFITGLSVVLVPALVAITTRTLPRPPLLIGILSATIGLALLSLSEDFRLNQGDLLVLLCAISFALHIYLVGRYAPEADAAILAAAQILSVSLLSGLFSLIVPQSSMHFTANVWLGLMLTAIPATSLAFFIQTKMQQFTSPSHTALIFASEPVFSAIFAFFLAGEILTPRGLLGAALVLTGMLVAEFNGGSDPLARSK
ncbi:MAG: DMT family transporter [Desulfitobacteriaceae bacterium]|nr:DMT family transporter [Desulfitobacteriaceae bacterium]MDI6879135.1 DMT family transporter [Desulfitobacteriaceae bacterium]MDI6913290.1 DMT family transporter [Desulfitobacteriaceae bacterium]